MTDLIAIVDKAFQDDPEAASILVDEVVQNYVIDLFESMGHGLQDALGQEFQRRTNIAKAALGRQYVDTISKGEYPDEDVAKTAHWLSHMDAYIDEIRKATGRNLLESWFIGGQETPRNVSRDPQGRFMKIVDTKESRIAVGADKLSPALNDRFITTGDSGRQLSEEGRKHEESINRHQSQYEQADEHVRDLYRLFKGDAKGVRIKVDYLKGSKISQTPLEFDLKLGKYGLPEDQISSLNPTEDTILSVNVEVGPDASPDTKARVERFHMFNVVGDQAILERTKGNWQAAIGRRDPNQGRAARTWERASAASKILNATGNVKAAEFARLVGVMGPEAETVLGPYIQQAAYRYRGTEKSPDKDLLEEFNSVDMKLINAGQKPVMDEGRGSGVVYGSYERNKGKASGDQLKLDVRSDVAASYLIRALPTDPFTAKLSEQAGHVLPSQGVVINADGEVVSQAVGYSDDHYLPFDLKNLASLRGGQYVRTRVSGGLTGEDIYTAIQSGARMATVVSTSGVFSIQFDQNFRGARGNSDKARSMYDRYLKILDAVDNSNMYLKDVSPSVYEDADAHARSLVSGDLSTEIAQNEYKSYRDKYLDDARRDQRSGYDVDALMNEAKLQARQESDYQRLTPAELSRREMDIYDDLRHEYQSSQVQELSLNAAGYDVALKTLKQQFPYFIRDVSYRPLATGKRGKDGAGLLDSIQAPASTTALGARIQSSGRNDRGYVERGNLRPNLGGPKAPVAGSGSTEPKTTVERSDSQGGGKSKAEGAEGAASSGDSASSAPASKDQALLKRLALYGPRTQRDAQQSLGRLIAPLQKMGAASRGGVEPAAGVLMDWNSAKDTDQKTIMVQYLLSHHGELGKLLRDDAAVSALGDRKAVTDAFDELYTRGLQDELNSDPSLRAAFGDATTSTAAVDFIVNQSMDVANRYRLDNPFNNSDGRNVFVQSDKPIPFPDMMALDNSQKLKNYVSHEGSQAASALSGITNPNETIPKMIEFLQELNDPENGFRQKAQQESKSNPESMADTLASMVGIKTDELAYVLGTTPSGLGAASWSPDAVTRRAATLQRAWTLWQVQRILDVIEDRPGGIGPKVPAPQGSSLVAKNVYLENLQERLSLPVAVLPHNHPLSVTVLLNKATGRPLLSR